MNEREASYYKLIILLIIVIILNQFRLFNKENYDLRDPDKDNRGI